MMKDIAVQEYADCTETAMSKVGQGNNWERFANRGRGSGSWLGSQPAALAVSC
jgi:hypothetical protein